MTRLRAADGLVAEAKRMMAQEEPIAIIGMKGRFPGANDLDEYWKNLAGGVESISILDEEEMRAAGVPDHVSRLPGYVNASPVLDGVDKFDAQFFGFSARDATLTDPQHRLFLETAWEALEDAGYDPEHFGGPIGVFGGSELSTYLYHLYQNQDALKYIDGMQLMVTNDKDHLCTQVSYRLNLKGPSVVVQTTCSTSLVAVSMACESLHQGRCDMALAGGVTVRVPQRGGYFYTAGSILSPDGHCRPFDARAQGTIVGSGVGLIVLKRLGDALRDRDGIRAVILGTGINNDGSDKVGYTAPSVSGQSAAIRAAYRMAGISASSIGYVEAHGTGTILGDPIEITALTEVFREASGKRGFCGIGSVKSNFGHLSCAAGIAGLIKTVLSMEHGAIPPTVHYTSPNPGIDLAASPFYVTQKLARWTRNGTARRAGVSSFGVGGTNAHIVIEEAPVQDEPSEGRPFQAITLSARSEAALHAAEERLADHLARHPEIGLPDAAATLHLGRKAFHFRQAVVVAKEDRGRAIAALESAVGQSARACPSGRLVVFMFPGQGSQYPDMAKGLYDGEIVVREAIDRCAQQLKRHTGQDIRKVLFRTERSRGNAARALRDTKWAQPALFTVSYALAKLWQSWGVHPAMMIGHSVGEYVAATLAEVMTLEDALAVIAKRGQLISALPRGSMLGVLAGEDVVGKFVKGKVSLAAINAPGFSVLSGPTSAIARVQKALEKESIAARRLHTSHAFHSSMMDPILAEFESVLAKVKLHAPKIPFMATLQGKPAGIDVTHPAYWVAQLRNTVRFGDGLRRIAEEGALAGKEPVYIEVGPGNALTTFVNAMAKAVESKAECVNSLPAAESGIPDTQTMLTALANLWVAGVPVDWHRFHATEQRRRVSLPTYPFERQSYWVGALPDAKNMEAELRDTSKWMYRAVWNETGSQKTEPGVLDGKKMLVFDDAGTPGSSVADALRAEGAKPIIVRRGGRFEKTHDGYEINPDEAEDYRILATAACAGDERLAGVVYCWNAMSPAKTSLDDAAPVALLGPMRLAHALSSQQTVRPLPMLFVARGTALVNAEDLLDPARGLGAGVARVLPQEHPGLRVAHADVDDDSRLATMIVAELASGLPDPAMAMRNGRRFVEGFVPAATSAAKTPLDLPESPVVLITGGLGHMGLHLAEVMFAHVGARLVLLGRTSLPIPAEWAAASEDPSVSEGQRTILKRLATMREKRDEVMVLRADLNREPEVREAVDLAIRRFGKIDLVVHGAARIDAAAFASAAETGREVMEAQFSPKIRGLHNMMEAMKGREPARWVLHSSISSILGGLGLAAYSAVNALLDVLALQQGERWLSIDWDAWDNAAEAQNVSMPLAITPREGGEALLRLLASPVGSRAIVAVNLAERLQAWVQHKQAASGNGAGTELHPRPNLATTYVEPRNDVERGLAEIWGRQLGIDAVGIHDRFFDLGGHSLLAAQVATEICERFQIELPVLRLFQAPTIGELAIIVAKAQSGDADAKAAGLPFEQVEATQLEGDAPGRAAKQSYRDFYDDVTRRLQTSGVGEASFFLNYGYVSKTGDDEARFEVPERVFNRNSVRLVFELIGNAALKGKRVLDVGCGRGGMVALMAETLLARAVGMDLSPEAIAFCRRTHKHGTKFEVGDSENMPFKDRTFDVVTNVESSHTYPNLRAFYGEVGRVIRSKGMFLYTDLLPVGRWLEVRALLAPLGFKILSERDITQNVLASCDDVAATRAQAFGGHDAMIDNFLAVPGSAVYEQMSSGAWQYRILRAQRV
ncbi:MAG: SDR family NAD(P)-dependent oxidoreductase [Proteobacteria bacterium]|nr:SDR family NAD(P)-dependent oxidoreductase [Pseudomonadota bacterium]